MKLDTADNAPQLLGMINSETTIHCGPCMPNFGLSPGLFQTGGFIGTLTLPVFADRFGRKWGLFLVWQYDCPGVASCWESKLIS